MRMHLSQNKFRPDNPLKAQGYM